MGRSQDIPIDAEEHQGGRNEMTKDEIGGRLSLLIAEGRSILINKGTVIIGKMQIPVQVARRRFGSNGHTVQPLITAAEAESKIDSYTAKLIKSIEAANKRYVANNPSGTHPTIGDEERLLIRMKVSQTISKCFSIAPEEIVQKARKRTS
jgi:hypothetical protein